SIQRDDWLAGTHFAARLIALDTQAWNFGQGRALAGGPSLGCATVHQINRRRLLGSSAILLLMTSPAAQASVIKGSLPGRPGAADPPDIVTPGGWKYFTGQEAATVEAFVDRLIPADNLSPGGKDCGCAIYIDRQLAGPYGRSEGWYMSGPFQDGTKQQGPQS